ncbi:hypothetical protein LshimejAT787_1400110 [Lyophyllum shimeji]|uniref:Uncharacterized protein n=1 Tax=Lyophyllum shimeji TaxID=47721 RepID=A0A9P3PXY4_LYOSH|nr:hypothetical protein LshimejAT787_1400110 [Lyophyllum shimeji]
MPEPEAPIITEGSFAEPMGLELPEFREALDYIYKFEAALKSDQATQEWKPPPMEEGHKGRYLWTDAFGVVDFLTLYGLTGQDQFLTFAHRLIETVHDVLGKTRDGSQRLPGATDDNPLGGGLRIGKLEETGPDGDGQYHHYLTIWMFALNRYSIAAKDPHYNSLAIKCARAIHRKFVAGPRIYWKMAMDLSRPLVASQGNLDPFDGYVVFDILNQHKMEGEEGLEQEIHNYKSLVDMLWTAYTSNDPLDLGMTLWTVQWKLEEEWARHMKGRAMDALRQLEIQGEFENAVGFRLAFREFGTVMGVKCHDEFASQPFWGRRWINKVLYSWKVIGVVPTPKPRIRTSLIPITEVMYSAALLPGAFRKGWIEDHMKR